MLPDVCARPEVGRITGRGNTANLEVVLALKPDLILDVGSTSADLRVARRPRAGADRHSLRAARRPLRRHRADLSQARRADRIAATQAEALARYADETMTTITRAHRRDSAERRPRVYYARGPRGLETGLGGSINVETIEFLGARNVAAERKGGLAIVSVEQVLLWNPDVIVTIDQRFRGERAQRSGLVVGRGGARGPRASVAEAAVRLGRFPAVGQPADRPVVAREDSLSGAIPGGPARAHARFLHGASITSRRATRRSSMCWRDGTDTRLRGMTRRPPPARLC